VQYGNQLPSTYSQLKIQIDSVETENKEKLEELNKKIGNTSSTFNTQHHNIRKRSERCVIWSSL
jgi:hypothetical protein